MRTHARRLLRAVLLPCVVVPGTAACPLPIAHTEPVAPPIVGRFVRSDGAPLAGTRVAVARAGDTECRRTLALTTTDAAGTFRLPATRVRERVVWVVPNYDRAAPSYALCVAARDTLRRAYVGVGSLDPRAEGDSLRCLQWEFEARARVTCTRRSRYEEGGALSEGGAWTDDGRSGWFRLIVPAGQPWEEADRGVFVQWVERSPADTARLVVRATVDLAAASGLAHVDEPRLRRRLGRWEVAALGADRRRARVDTRRVYFQLGPPGVVTTVAVERCGNAWTNYECKAEE